MSSGSIITMRTLEAYKPKAKRYKVKIDSGLHLYVHPSGRKIWGIRFVIDGKQVEITMQKPFGVAEGCLSLAQARAENERIQILAKQGIDFRTHAEEEKKQVQERNRELEVQKKTFHELYDAWITEGVSRENDNADLKRIFSKDILPHIGKLPVAEVTDTHIFSLLQKVKKERDVDRMTAYIHQSLTQLFNWGLQRRPWRDLLVDGNVAKLVNIRQIISPEYRDVNGRRDRVLSAEEIQEIKFLLEKSKNRFAAASKEERTQITRPLPDEIEIAVWICLSTLCRIGELQLAEWKHVNFETGEWFIPKENVKSVKGVRRDLLVFLSPFALAKFKTLHRLTGTKRWCFPNEKGSSHVGLKWVTNNINERQVMFGERNVEKSRRKFDNSLVVSKGENGKWTPHDLRRTGATIMQSLKIYPDTIDLCQNHETKKTSETQRHYLLYTFSDEKKEAWSKLGEYLHNLFSDPFQEMNPF